MQHKIGMVQVLILVTHHAQEWILIQNDAYDDDTIISNAIISPKDSKDQLFYINQQAVIIMILSLIISYHILDLPVVLIIIEKTMNIHSIQQIVNIIFIIVNNNKIKVEGTSDESMKIAVQESLFCNKLPIIALLTHHVAKLWA